MVPATTKDDFMAANPMMTIPNPRVRQEPLTAANSVHAPATRERRACMNVAPAHFTGSADFSMNN
jgi:hypothetical protein